MDTLAIAFPELFYGGILNIVALGILQASRREALEETVVSFQTCSLYDLRKSIEISLPW